MTNDLTIIFLTANEHPEHWVKFHQDHLIKAADGKPIITVSRKPVDLGINLIDEEPQSHRNMYRQLLRAAKLATTDYIATAESDTLYHKDHYNFCRPPKDSVAYDMSRWLLYTWNPLFSLKDRISNCTLIAPREYLIDALEERYGDNSVCPPDRVGEVGRHLHEKALGLTERNAIKVWCHSSTIQVNHPNGTNFREMANGRRKKLGEVKAIEIPYWGKAEDLAKEYR